MVQHNSTHNRKHRMLKWGDDFRLRRRVIQFQDGCLHVTEQDTTVENNKGTQKKREDRHSRLGSQIAKKRQTKPHASRLCGSVQSFKVEELSKNTDATEAKKCFLQMVLLLRKHSICRQFLSTQSVTQELLATQAKSQGLCYTDTSYFLIAPNSLGYI